MVHLINEIKKICNQIPNLIRLLDLRLNEDISISNVNTMLVRKTTKKNKHLDVKSLDLIANSFGFEVKIVILDPKNKQLISNISNSNASFLEVIKSKI